MAQRRDVQADILRAIQSPKVCSRAGSVLRSGSGGSEATYNLSEPCEVIDVFLSHSWRDSGMLKYLAICLHFNAALAMWCGFATGFGYFLLQRFYGVLDSQAFPWSPS